MYHQEPFSTMDEGAEAPLFSGSTVRRDSGPWPQAPSRREERLRLATEGSRLEPGTRDARREHGLVRNESPPPFPGAGRPRVLCLPRGAQGEDPLAEGDDNRGRRVRLLPGPRTEGAEEAEVQGLTRRLYCSAQSRFHALHRSQQRAAKDGEGLWAGTCWYTTPKCSMTLPPT